MNEFVRQPESNNIFEHNENSRIVLRYNSDWESRYNNNSENSINFYQLKEILSKENTCYWQKNKVESRTNRNTGKATTNVSHKIIIPINDEKAIWIIGSLSMRKINQFDSEFAYFIVKIKEISFLKPPSNNTIIKNSSFKLLDLNEEGKTSHNNDFKEIYNEIEKLDIPTKDINKDADKQIWDNYVVALKRLVKKREQVWKIKNISPPYFEKKNSFIDVEINEDDLINQFEENIIDAIGKKKIEDWGVNKSNAFFELRNYTELSSLILENIKAIGNEFFYELTEESPIHKLSGHIGFTYLNEETRADIFDDIETRLGEYEINKEIDENGKIDIVQKELKFLEKIIADSYKEIIEIRKDSKIKLKLNISKKENEKELKEDIDRILQDEKKINWQKVRIDSKNQKVSIEVSAFIPPNLFNTISLNYVETEYRVKPKNIRIPNSVEGVVINNNVYEFSASTKEELNQIIDRINKANSINQDYYKDFIKKPTIYIFKYSPLELLREYKLLIENNNRKFDIASSILTLFPNNNEDYKSQLKEIISFDFNVSYENKDFSPNYYIQFVDDISKKRDDILNRIENKFKADLPININTEVFGKSTKLIFSFTFEGDEQREEIKEKIKVLHSDFSSTTNIFFENELGRTFYEFEKNEELEANKEREVAKGVRQAKFIFLNEDDKRKYEEERNRKGDNESFRGGVDFGKLVRKDGSKLKFRLDDNFEFQLNTNEENRIEFDELKKGYIKPTFIGDLINIGRMISAMKKVTDPGGWNGSPANPNLPNFIFDSREAREGNLDLAQTIENVTENLIETNLNPKQIEAVAKAINVEDLLLIQGPPGTGKTTVIAEIIWQTLNIKPDAKILITSQTNLAVDNAIERLSGKRIVRPLRIGNIDKFEDEGKVYSVDRISKWMNSESNSKEENDNANNAIESWIKTIGENCSADELYSKAITKWKKQLDEKSIDIKEAFHSSYKKHINILAATCSECGSGRFKKTFQEVIGHNSDNDIPVEFDLVIMDEASKATPPELILPLTFGKKVIILGDHKQLPPMLDEKEFDEALESVGFKKLVEDWSRGDYKTSQFEKLFKNAPKSIVSSLDTQFRMHEQIMNCITQFYKDQEEFDDGLICGIKDTMNIPDYKHKGSRWHGFTKEPFINPDRHAIWVNVSSPESTVGTGTSYKNEGEIEAVKLVLKNLISANGFPEYIQSKGKDEEKEIGVITFYMPQMQEIKKALYPNLSKAQMYDFENHKLENEFNLPFRINTVDRFQGMEREILIISTVRSNSQLYEKGGKVLKRKNTNYPRALGFAKEFQRINVGFSRAKRLLIVIGNQEHFENREEYAEAIRKMHKIDVSQLKN